MQGRCLLPQSYPHLARPNCQPAQSEQPAHSFRHQCRCIFLTPFFTILALEITNYEMKGGVRASATQSEWTRLAQAVTRYLSHATCHTLLVTRYLSRVTCHALLVASHMLLVMGTLVTLDPCQDFYFLRIFHRFLLHCCWLL